MLSTEKRSLFLPMKTWVHIVPSVFLHVVLHSIGCLSYALLRIDFLYGMPTPDFERTSASFWLLHWSRYVTCQALREFRQLIGNHVHLLTLAYTMLGDQICETAWFVEIRMMLIDAGRACVLPFEQYVPLSASTISYRGLPVELQLLQHHLAILYTPVGLSLSA